MYNPQNIYLHDTNARSRFSSRMRALSHGCIRTEHIMDLATELLGDDGGTWTPDKIQAQLATGKTKQANFVKPLPVYIVYFSSAALNDGKIVDYQDLYGRDGKAMAALNMKDGGASLAVPKPKPEPSRGAVSALACPGAAAAAIIKSLPGWSLEHVRCRPARPQQVRLFIQGSDGGFRRDDGRIKLPGNNDLDRLIGDPSVPLVQLTADILERSALPAVTSYRCLINQISDADSNRRILEHLDRLLSGFDGRIVNSAIRRPQDEPRRDGEAACRDAGLRVPKVARLRNRDDAQEKIERAGLSFPIILRHAGTHGGQILGLFATIDDVRRAIPGDDDLFATEHADFQSADGLYRKYRICVIGRSIIVRHMIVSDGWNIHGRDRRRLMLGRAELREEERHLLERPLQALSSSVVETLRAVRKRIPLDYFGMDFGIDADGAVVLFEANATMDFISPIIDPEFAYGRHVLALGAPRGSRDDP